MTKQLRISPALALPTSAVTSTLVVYGGKGMGKTNLGAVIIEEMAKAGLRWRLLDPLGVSYGLRHSKDGKGKGVECLILGGVHGDMPIEPEAARYIPQLIPAGRQELAFCVGAWEQLVEEGRNIGIGVGLLTQRSARMNKSVSELADSIFAFRTIGPNSLDAILDWLGDHVAKARIKELIEEIRQLEVGDCLVVSPGWLKHEGIVHIRERETFDSSATPRPGERQKKVSGAAAVPDLAKYLDRMKDTIDKAKAADPRELQKEITRLRGELKKAGNMVVHSLHAPAKASTPDPAVIQRHVDAALAAERRSQRTRLDRLRATMRLVSKHHVKQIEDGLANVRHEIEGALELLDDPTPAPTSKPSVVSIDREPLTRILKPIPVPCPSRPDIAPGQSNGALAKGERVVLTAIAQHGDEGVTREQLTVLTGYKRSTRDTYIQRMQTAGRVAVRGDRITATDNGLETLGSDFEPLPTGDRLLEHWLQAGKLPIGEARILTVLANAYPDAVARDTISEATGFARSSRDTYIQRMKARKLVVDDNGGVRMSANLHG